MALSQAEIKAIVTELQGQVSRNTYKECLVFGCPAICYLRMNIKTKQIESFDEIPDPVATYSGDPYIFFWPEIVMHDIYTGEDIHKLGPFDQYVLKYIFKSDNLDIVRKRIIKHCKAEEKTDKARRASYSTLEKAIPKPEREQSHDDTREPTEPIPRLPPKESEEARVQRIAGCIARDFGNNW